MKFSIKQIVQIVNQELARCREFTNWHGITPENIEKHLVFPPCSKRFKNSFQPGYLWLWVVLDEIPQDKNGYLIVYDPRAEKFGLATKPDAKQYGMFIGFYGDLRETIEAM